MVVGAPVCGDVPPAGSGHGVDVVVVFPGAPVVVVVGREGEEVVVDEVEVEEVVVDDDGVDEGADEGAGARPSATTGLRTAANAAAAMSARARPTLGRMPRTDLTFVSQCSSGGVDRCFLIDGAKVDGLSRRLFLRARPREQRLEPRPQPGQLGHGRVPLVGEDGDLGA